MTTDKTISATDNRMQKSLEALKRELSTIRSGRASPSLVEHLLVDYYGVPTPLNQVATINAQEARLLVVQPWDKKTIPAIEKTILKSDLGLNPSNDGNVVRLPIPPLSEERRQELVKLVRKRLEEGKIAIRNIRRDALEELRQQERGKEISQDELKRRQERLQKITDSFVAQAEKIVTDKETELMQV